MTKTEMDILFALHKHKEIQGTERLCLLIKGNLNHKGRVFASAFILAGLGMIDMTISPGGRGYTTTYRDAGVIKVQR